MYLDSEAHRRLKRIARDRACPPAQLIREAVVEYVARHGRRPAARSVGAFRSGRPDLGERAEELLAGMGRPR